VHKASACTGDRDHACEAPIVALGAHEHELVVERQLQVPHTIHGPTHWLRLQPDVAVAPALHEHLKPWRKSHSVAGLCSCCMGEQGLRGGIRGAKVGSSGPNRVGRGERQGAVNPGDAGWDESAGGG
jgi:hypothetical protein